MSHKKNIYIAWNYRNPKNLLKVGMTKDVASRMETLSKDTGVSGYFKPLHVFKVTDMVKAEGACHKALKEYRQDGEFFQIGYEDCLKICFSIIREFLDPSDELYDKDEENLSIKFPNKFSNTLLYFDSKELHEVELCGLCQNKNFIAHSVLSTFGEENQFLEKKDLRFKLFKTYVEDPSKMKLLEADLLDIDHTLFVSSKADWEFSRKFILRRWQALRRLFDHYFDSIPKYDDGTSNQRNPKLKIYNIDCLRIIKHWLENKPDAFLGLCWNKLINHQEMQDTHFMKEINSIKDRFEIEYEKLSDDNKFY